MTKIAIIGLGYVGLSIAIEFGKKFPVIGFDTNRNRIDQLKNCHDVYHSASESELKMAKIIYSDDESCLADADFFIISVPTPVDKNHQPDLRDLERVCATIGKYLKKNAVIVNESTVYPGATEEICIPLLEKMSGFKSGEDFFVGYSPERINPGDREHPINKITKIIAGQNSKALELIKNVYEHLSEGGVYVCSSIKVAEAIKIFENTQRDVNIALLNEFDQFTHAMHIDIFEVIDGLKTKWNYLDFSPGFVGGHCISVDPYYLAYKARKLGTPLRLIETAREINNNLQPIIDHVISTLSDINPAATNPTIGVFGLSYKEDIPDFRNSMSIDLVKSLNARGYRTFAHDPNIDPATQGKLNDIRLTDFDALPTMSAIIITKSNSGYKKLGLNKICEKLEPQGCLFDMTGMFRNQHLSRTDVHYEAC
jgi:UDP-N-acetyl-D-galactosamine dehydrogenase